MLYTAEYQQQQQQMHECKRQYGGVQSVTFAERINDDLQRHQSSAVLDYGAGRGHLGESLFSLGYRGFYRPYDPGIPWWSQQPEPAPYVCCLDVLEHIEPDCLDDVLSDLQRVTTHRGFFTIHTEPAKKHLPDGRNAHLIIQPIEWWLEKLRRLFVVTEWATLYAKNEPDRLVGAAFSVEPLP